MPWRPKKRGPEVVVSPLILESRKLLAAKARLTKRLQTAELIIEVQKSSCPGLIVAIQYCVPSSLAAAGVAPGLES